MQNLVQGFGSGLDVWDGFELTAEGVGSREYGLRQHWQLCL